MNCPVCDDYVEISRTDYGYEFWCDYGYHDDIIYNEE